MGLSLILLIDHHYNLKMTGNFISIKLCLDQFINCMMKPWWWMYKTTSKTAKYHQFLGLTPVHWWLTRHKICVLSVGREAFILWNLITHQTKKKITVEIYNSHELSLYLLGLPQYTDLAIWYILWYSIQFTIPGISRHIININIIENTINKIKKQIDYFCYHSFL